jgi:hypothetical protein
MEPVTLYKGSDVQTVSTASEVKRLEGDGWSRQAPSDGVVATVAEAEALRAQAAAQEEAAPAENAALAKAAADADAPLTVETVETVPAKSAAKSDTKKA